jgi:hypothetical protein
MIGDELIGAVFVNATELRHLAEREFGQLFVPVELLSDQVHGGVFALQVRGVGRLVVHADREREWHPYHITRLERPRADRSWVPATGRSAGAVSPPMVAIPRR